MKTNINSIEDVEMVSGMLHDATILFEEIKFNKETKVFSAVFNRHMWEQTKRKGIFRKMEMQAVHSMLTFENVSSMKIDTENEIYPTNEISCLEAEGSKINIFFHNDVVITLEVEKYCGNLNDLDQPWDITGPISLSFGKD